MLAAHSLVLSFVSSATNLLLILIAAILFVTFFGSIFRRRDVGKYLPGTQAPWLLSTLVGVRYLWKKRQVVTYSEALLEAIYGTTKIFQKEGLFRFWFLAKPIVPIYDAELLEDFLGQNKHITKSFFYGYLSPWLKHGLLTSTNSLWKERRRLLTPAFHFRILEDHLPLMDQHTRKLAEILSSRNDWFDIFPLMALCTLDIMATTSMGVEFSCLEKSESDYVRNIKRIGTLAMERFVNPIMKYDSVYNRTESGKQFKESVEGANNFITQLVKEKREKMLQNKGKEEPVKEEEQCLGVKRRKAFMDILLEEHFKNSNLTTEAIEEEVQTFLFAGHDTTSVGNSWTLYLLGRHPKIQRKVQEEIDAVFGCDIHAPITPEHLKQMKYAEMVIKESNRLCPPVPFVQREILEDATIGKYPIPKGTTVTIFILGLHRNPRYFPEPEKFDPDRFLPENMKDRHPFAYIPFSAGQRNCIGQRFAMMEQKIALANVMRRCTIEARDHFDQLILTPELVTVSKTPPGLQIRCFPRIRNSGKSNQI